MLCMEHIRADVQEKNNIFSPCNNLLNVRAPPIDEIQDYNKRKNHRSAAVIE